MAVPARQEMAQKPPRVPHKLAKAAVRREPKPPPAPAPRRPTFFHSRNCEVVTPAEIDVDSDDEVDQEEWAVRQSRCTRATRVDSVHTALTRPNLLYSMLRDMPIHLAFLTNLVRVADLTSAQGVCSRERRFFHCVVPARWDRS